MSLNIEAIDPSDGNAAKFLARKHYQMLINNEWVNSVSNELIDSTNPATGESLGQFPSGNAQDIDLAVKAARYAFDQGEWSTLNARKR